VGGGRVDRHMLILKKKEPRGSGWTPGDRRTTWGKGSKTDLLAPAKRRRTSHLAGHEGLGIEKPDSLSRGGTSPGKKMVHPIILLRKKKEGFQEKLSLHFCYRGGRGRPKTDRRKWPGFEGKVLARGEKRRGSSKGSARHDG